MSVSYPINSLSSLDNVTLGFLLTEVKAEIKSRKASGITSAALPEVGATVHFSARKGGVFGGTVVAVLGGSGRGNPTRILVLAGSGAETHTVTIFPKQLVDIETLAIVQE
jgi:hypothetical protein